MLLVLGSNEFIDTSAVIVADGIDQVVLEIGKRDDEVLLTMEVFDESGSHIARLRRNAWAFNVPGLTVTTSPGDLTLSDGGKVILRAAVLRKDAIEVTDGEFFTPKGTRITIRPDGLHVGGLTLRGNRLVAMGAGLVITSVGIGIGASSKPGATT